MAAQQQTIAPEGHPAHSTGPQPEIDDLYSINPFAPSIGCQCNQARAKLAAKLIQVMAACAVVSKDKANSEQNYKYVSSDAILAKVNGALVGAKLATVCQMDVIDRQPRTTRSGAVWELVTVKCILSIIDSETGVQINSEGIGQGYDSSDKAFSKAQTQSKKYALMLMLNISTGDDPESFSQAEAEEEPTICKHCGQAAEFKAAKEFEGQTVKVYCCPKCKKETRLKA